MPISTSAPLTISTTSRYRKIILKDYSDPVDVAFDDDIDIISSEEDKDLAHSSLQVR